MAKSEKDGDGESPKKQINKKDNENNSSCLMLLISGAYTVFFFLLFFFFFFGVSTFFEHELNIVSTNTLLIPVGRDL